MSQELRGHEFKAGYEFIINNSETMGLAALEEIAYPLDDYEKHLSLLYELLDADMEERLLKVNHDDRDNVTDVDIKVSSQFVKGMKEAAKELLEKSK